MKRKAHIKRETTVWGVYSRCGWLWANEDQPRWLDKNTPKEEICKSCLKTTHTFWEE